MDGFEEIIQFILEGAFDHIYEEEDHVVEKQQPLSNEIFGWSAVAWEEILWKDDFIKESDEIGTNFQKQVPCQHGRSFEDNPAFLASFWNRIRFRRKHGKYIIIWWYCKI